MVKADGLAAGKGVTVAKTLVRRWRRYRQISPALRRGGRRGRHRGISRGEEVSFFACATARPPCRFGSAQDHKRVGDHDNGPNTGGMGAYSPTPVITAEMIARRCANHRADSAGMAAAGMPFNGVLYAGVMITAQGPNCSNTVRFGDPECQVLMMRLKPTICCCCSGRRDGELRHPTPAGAPSGADGRDGVEGLSRRLQGRASDIQWSR